VVALEPLVGDHLIGARRRRSPGLVLHDHA
jgi:hypothetical protein